MRKDRAFLDVELAVKDALYVHVVFVVYFSLTLITI